jgi:hypothetical protein
MPLSRNAFAALVFAAILLNYAVSIVYGIVKAKMWIYLYYFPDLEICMVVASIFAWVKAVHWFVRHTQQRAA